MIESPLQFFAFATYWNAARQWPAWLSPTSANVSVPLTGPNWHTGGDPVSIVRHGLFGSVRARAGEGETVRSSASLEHARSGSRAAAPKQGGACAPGAAIANRSASRASTGALSLPRPLNAQRAPVAARVELDALEPFVRR